MKSLWITIFILTFGTHLVLSQVDEDSLLSFIFTNKLRDSIEGFVAKYSTDNATVPTGLSANCERDYLRYIDVLADGLIIGSIQPWALQMKDSDGKQESGQISGNLVAEGMYDQCREVREDNSSNPDAIRGQYVLAAWYGPILGPVFMEGIGFCIPDTCTSDDAMILLRVDYAQLDPLTDTVYMNYVQDPDLSDDPAAIVSITILCIFGAIAMVATIYHVIQQIRTMPQIEDNSKPSDDTAQNGTTQNGTNLAFSPDKSDMNLSGMNGDAQNGDVVLGVYKRRDPDDIVVNDGANQNNNNSRRGDGNGDDKRSVSITEKLERVLLSFSLLDTVPKIVSGKHVRGSFECVNGLRFLAMAWIILGHTYQLGPLFKPIPNLVNRFTYLDGMEDASYYVINQMQISVETFFILSAFLVSMSFLKMMKRADGRLKAVQWIMYYVHRYWRLTPVYMIILMFWTNLYRYFSVGPFVFNDEIHDAQKCDEVWWKLLLYVNNIWYTDGCMGWTWYLANDWQYYVIAPLFLTILYFNEIIGIIGIALGFCGGLIANIVLYHDLITNPDTELNSFEDIYVKPWTRCMTYFMGMFLGWLVLKTGRKVRINWIINVICWFVAISLVSIVVFADSTKTCDPESSSVCGPWTEAGEIAFRSLERPMFGLAVCWMLFACITGNGGIFNSVFSWNFFVPLAKLSYVGYLIHPIICYHFFLSAPVQQYYYNYFFGVILFLGNLSLTMGLSLVITAVFEVPLLGVEKVIFPKRK